MDLIKKIVILGNFGVGKTSLIRKFVTNEFSSDYKVTIGVHVLKKEINVAEKNISFVIWDLEGTDDLQKINRAYLAGAHGLVYVFDVKRPSTYKDLEQNITFLKTNYKPNSIKIIGNKADLLDEDEYHKIKNASSNPDFFTSAKSGENVEALFVSLAKDLL